MKVVLTGGAGFIGSCLLQKLNQEGITDILVVDHLGDSAKWRNLAGKHFTDYIEKDDFLRLVSENKLDKDFERIVHLGACTSTTCFDASYMMKNNYQYSRSLAEFALRRKIPFLYASSAATYGLGDQGFSDEDAASIKLNPLNIYGYSKQLFDLWVIRNGLIDKVTGFKFFNVFGPNEYHKGEMMSVIAKSFDKILKEKKIRLFKSCRQDYADGEQKRDFIYVKDAVDIETKIIGGVGTKTSTVAKDHEVKPGQLLIAKEDDTVIAQTTMNYYKLLDIPEDINLDAYYAVGWIDKFEYDISI